MARTRKLASDIIVHLIAVLAAIAFVFPFYLMVVASVKPNIDQFTNPPILIPTRITLEAYFNLFTRWRFTSYFINSLVIGLGSTALSLLIATPLAYSLARFQFGKNRAEDLSLFILSTRMAPPITAIIPLYIVMRTYGLIDTFEGMIIAYSVFNLPFAVWMLRGFFKELPIEMEEAALVDGCSRLGTFRRVALPLVAGGLAATAIFCIIFSWNEFIFAVMLTSRLRQTIPVAISGFIGDQQYFWGEMAAAATLSAIPMLIFAMLVQKHMIRGLTLGAVK